jgi:tellurite resistance protein TehA-like permease
LEIETWLTVRRWFALTAGTGIVAILLERLPYHLPGLHYVAIGLFALDVFLLCLFLGLILAQYIICQGKFMEMLHHPGQLLFTGTLPMTVGTLVNLTVYICVPIWEERATMFAWMVWWVDVVLSLATCLYIPFVM